MTAQKETKIGRKKREGDRERERERERVRYDHVPYSQPSTKKGGFCHCLKIPSKYFGAGGPFMVTHFPFVETTLPPTIMEVDRGALEDDFPFGTPLCTSMIVGKRVDKWDLHPDSAYPRFDRLGLSSFFASGSVSQGCDLLTSTGKSAELQAESQTAGRMLAGDD